MTGRCRDVNESPASRIFVSFRRWPLVPSAELYRLQSALAQCVELVGSDSARELLSLVTGELHRRTAEGPHGPPQNALAIRPVHP